YEHRDEQRADTGRDRGGDHPSRLLCRLAQRVLGNAGCEGRVRETSAVTAKKLRTRRRCRKDKQMSSRQSKLSAFLAAVALVAASSPASAIGSGELLCAQLQDVAGTSRGDSQSPLERARRACPLLGAIIEEFALQ